MKRKMMGELRLKMRGALCAPPYISYFLSLKDENVPQGNLYTNVVIFS